MKLFLNDAESPFARCFMEVAHDKGHAIVAARQQVVDEPFQAAAEGSPQILPWNLASIFSIRLVLRQCHYRWNQPDDVAVNYLLFLQSSMVSASLFRDKLHDVHQKMEEQLYGQLVLLRELENQRAKSGSDAQSRIVFVVIEENNPVELLGGGIYSALRYSFHHILSNSNDSNILGFYTQSNHYESFSHFILDHLIKWGEKKKHIGKWLQFRGSWLLGNSFVKKWK